jgi:hypothetical protein
MKWFDNNPHLSQLGDTAPSIREHSRIFQCPGSPQLPYRRRHGEVKSVCHWGQRKLLLSEIEFFSEYGSSQIPTFVIYAGAAPGHHIPLLADMFPNLHFLLVDPSPFEIEETDRIHIRNEFFSEELARQLSKGFIGSNLDAHKKNSPSDCQTPNLGEMTMFFISDVRTADWTLMSSEEVDQAIIEDLHAQARFRHRAIVSVE